MTICDDANIITKFQGKIAEVDGVQLKLVGNAHNLHRLVAQVDSRGGYISPYF